VEELVKQLLEGVGALGIPDAITFAILYLLERAKVDKANETIIALTREVVAGMATTASSLEQVAEGGREVREGMLKIAETVTVLSAATRRTR